tara:strand:+ start:47 stop:337 length:291 start_codon:yes stop_codon:yes gene_type:complete
MKNKTKTQLNKMTKRDLLNRIEDLMEENNNLHNQKSNTQMLNVLQRQETNTRENDLKNVRRAAGVMRFQIFNHAFESKKDKHNTLKIVDMFIDAVL